MYWTHGGADTVGLRSGSRRPSLTVQPVSALTTTQASPEAQRQGLVAGEQALELLRTQPHPEAHGDAPVAPVPGTACRAQHGHWLFSSPQNWVPSETALRCGALPVLAPNHVSWWGQAKRRL